MDLCSELFDALEALDVRTAPLGLYACEEFEASEKAFSRLHQVWFLGLKPHLEQAGCIGISPSYDPQRDRCSPIRYGASQPIGKFLFKPPHLANVRLGIAQTSKVKVQKFGAIYRVDPQKQFQDRWHELVLAEQIREMWRRPTSQSQLST
jgi:hypothetical protein